MDTPKAPTDRCSRKHSGVRCKLDDGHDGPHSGGGYVWCCTDQSEAAAFPERLRHVEGCAAQPHPAPAPAPAPRRQRGTDPGCARCKGEGTVPLPAGLGAQRGACPVCFPPRTEEGRDLWRACEMIGRLEKLVSDMSREWGAERKEAQAALREADVLAAIAEVAADELEKVPGLVKCWGAFLGDALAYAEEHDVVLLGAVFALAALRAEVDRLRGVCALAEMQRQEAAVEAQAERTAREQTPTVREQEFAQLRKLMEAEHAALRERALSAEEKWGAAVRERDEARTAREQAERERDEARAEIDRLRAVCALAEMHRQEAEVEARALAATPAQPVQETAPAPRRRTIIASASDARAAKEMMGPFDDLVIVRDEDYEACIEITRANLPPGRRLRSAGEATQASAPAQPGSKE